MTGVGPNRRTIAAWALAELDPASKKAVIPATYFDAGRQET